MHYTRMHRALFLYVSASAWSVKPGFHPNAIACVGKQPIMVATASTEHPIGCCSQRTQRTQRKRLRLDGNRASVNYSPQSTVKLGVHACACRITSQYRGLPPPTLRHVYTADQPMHSPRTRRSCRRSASLQLPTKYRRQPLPDAIPLALQSN